MFAVSGLSLIFGESTQQNRIDVYEKMQIADPITAKIELDANKMAASWLIDEEEYSQFTIRYQFDLESVKRFSQKIMRHEGIVVGRLKKEARVTYNQLATVHENVRDFLEKFKLS